MKTTFLRTMICLLSLVLAWVAPGVLAQDCPENMLGNGDFSTFTGIGDMGSSNAVPPWAKLYSTPQIVADGCPDDAAMQMWGQMEVGEAIKQQLAGVGIQAGLTYRVSVCYKWNYSDHPTNPPYVRFRLSASSTEPTTYPSANPGNYVLIGKTPNTSSTDWITYTFPDWTATNDASWIAVNPENDITVYDLTRVSWGRIDNICIELVPSTLQLLSEIEAYTEPLETDDSGITNLETWDFQDPGGNCDWEGWTHKKYTPVGDFAQLMAGPTNYDFCCDDWSCQVVFVDDGNVVPSLPGTGGDWDYGPGGYTLNNSGGLTADIYEYLHNEIQSPPVTLPGTIGDLGAQLSFEVYRHEPLDEDTAGMLYYWRVRSADSEAGLATAEWRDWNVQYYGEPACLEHKQDITDLLDCGASHVQIALGVVESGWNWCYAGDDGTPAPYFSEVKLGTYDLMNIPVMRAREVDLFQDNFPAIGMLDFNDLSNNSIRLDAARNICDPQDLCNIPGDSAVVDVSFCGQASPVTLHYTLRPNPVFDPYRTALPPTGSINATQIETSNRYSVDFPDTGFFFPGDILHYYFQAGAVTLPETPLLNSFGDFSDLTSYPATYTVRGLPTIVVDGQGGFKQPKILFWNDSGNQDGINRWFSTLNSFEYDEDNQYGMGIHYDVYSTNCPTAGMGNGLGGRSTLLTLEGYDTILYSGGELAAYTVSRGDFCRDAGGDISLLASWMDLSTVAQPKNLFLTGGNLIYDLEINNSSTGTNFVENYLGVNLIEQDIRNVTGRQNTLDVQAWGSVFNDFQDWSVCGIEDCACGQYAINSIGVEHGATIVAQFEDPSGILYPPPMIPAIPTDAGVAATYFKAASFSQAIVLPYDLMQVHYRSKVLKTAQAGVLEEVLKAFGHPVGGPINEPVPGNCTAEMPNPLATAYSICVFPDGTGAPLTNGYEFGPSWGNTWRPGNCTVSLTLNNGATTPVPIAGYPLEDMWLESDHSGFVHCCRCGWLADHDTKADGTTTFSGSYPGGGYIEPFVDPALTFVVIDQGTPVSPNLPLYYNSPDINADCRVNLSDVGLFTECFFDPDYAYKCDFVTDGVNNLTDVTILAMTIGQVCLTPKEKKKSDAAGTPEFVEHQGSIGLGLYSDLQGHGTNLAAAPDQPFEIFLLATSSLDVSDIQAWECMVEVPDNIRVLEWNLADKALNVFKAPEFMVGLAEPAPAGSPVLLASARCVALDDKPALFHLRPFRIPSGGADSPVVVVGNTGGGTHLAAVKVGDGDPEAPVFGVNAADQMDAVQPVPTKFSLHANAPNPFNPVTLIRFDIPKSSRVELAIYATDGRRVKTLISETMSAGTHEVLWRGDDDRGRRMPSGVYFYRMTAGGFEQTERMMLIK